MSGPQILLLDTHVWVWFVTGDPRLSSKPTLLKAIETAAKKSQVKISIISIWEVGMLAAKGRLIFQTPLEKWIQDALSLPGFSLAPLSTEIAIDSNQLPGTFHGDPADRMIVATARNLGAILVTLDQQVLNYGKGHFVKVLGG